MFGLSETFACKAQDSGLVDESVDGSDGLSFRGEETLPVFEASVCGE